ncbi:lytic transglycosylase domain-containing protein [Limimaricola cinnabarinus]|uniref:lytic transglycosylase domain-containing protein n=1 Tax=Limimaricola cinnabarinus TaxID=1125964 RepID=UPI002FE0333B
MTLRFRGAVAAALCLACGAPALADRVSSSSAPSLFSSQLRVLDGRAASQYAGSDRLQPPRAEVPEALRAAAAPVPAFRGRYAGPYLDLARQAARKNRIPEDLFLRLVQQESGWNARAVSKVGALGLAQLMPGTARQLRVDPRDPVQNLDGGARYLRMQFDRFKDWRLALAAYNAGPGAVTKYGGIPPYAETRHYVKVILGN